MDWICDQQLVSKQQTTLTSAEVNVDSRDCAMAALSLSASELE